MGSRLTTRPPLLSRSLSPSSSGATRSPTKYPAPTSTNFDITRFGGHVNDHELDPVQTQPGHHLGLCVQDNTTLDLNTFKSCCVSSTLLQYKLEAYSLLLLEGRPVT